MAPITSDHEQKKRLLEIPQDLISENDLRRHIRIGIRYLEARLGDPAGMPSELMTNRAAAEAAIAEIWQRVQHPRAFVDDERKITLALVRQFVAEEMETLLWQEGAERFARGRFPEATELFDELIASHTREEFLTLKVCALLGRA